MKEKMQPGKLVPRYAVPWLLSALVWQLGLYFLAKLLTDGRFHYDLSIFLDDKIPFVPFFMLIYWGAYFSWGINYILAARENRDHCRLVCASTVLVKQHVFVDIFAGIAVAELGLLLSRRVWDSLEKRKPSGI